MDAPSAHADSSERTRYKLGVPPLIAILILVGIYGVRAAAETDPELMGHAIGTGLVIFLAAGLVAWILSRLTFAAFGSNAAGNIVYFVVFLAVVAATEIYTVSRVRSRAESVELESKLSEIRVAKRSELERTGEVKWSDESAARTQKILNEAAESASGVDKQITTAIAEVIPQLHNDARAYGIAVDAFSDAGGIYGETLVSVESINERLRLLDEYEHSHDSLAKTVRGYVDDVAAAMRRNGAPEENVVLFKNMISTSVSMRAKIKQCDVEEQRITSIRQYLEFLRDHFGKWRYSLENNRTTFANEVGEAKVEEFNLLLEDVLANDREFMKLQREAVNADS